MPLIGITCDYDYTTDRRGSTVGRYLCNAPYVDAVQAAGATALLLPYPASDSIEEIERLLLVLDGIVFTGGDFDVPPSFYGQPAHEKLGRVNQRRSEFERALMRSALTRKSPVLGVCGGMQLLNVVRGGTLFQDRSLRPDTDPHEQPHDKLQPAHAVQLSSTSRLAQACASESLEVNSTHHQMVDKVGEGLIASGHAPDGVIEVIEDPQAPFVVGVQWHPELLSHPAHRAIYRAFVAAASKQAPPR